jgi:hypothetical protein
MMAGLSFLIVAGCGAQPQTSSVASANSQLSTGCQKAQDDCKAQFDALHDKAQAFAKSCQDAITQACTGSAQAGASSACKQAQTDCADGAAQLQKDLESAESACQAEVTSACNASGAGGTSGVGNGNGNGGTGNGMGNGTGNGGGSGTGSGGTASGPSPACTMAIDACEKKAEALVQTGVSSIDCASAVLKACLDPTQMADCQKAIDACTQGVSQLQSAAADLVKQCEADIQAACQ